MSQRSRGSHGKHRSSNEIRLRVGDFVKKQTVRPSAVYEFKITKQLGEGNFATVYECVSIRDMPPGLRDLEGQPLALKFEKVEGMGELKKDVTLLQLLKDSRAVPRLVCEGTHQGNAYFVMEKCGKNLHDFKTGHVKVAEVLARQHPHPSNGAPEPRTLSLHQMDKGLVHALAYCILWCLKKMHRLGYVHRDVKLANFLLRYDDAKDEACVSMIDFGLSKMYRGEDGKHMEAREPDSKKFRGTTSFASIHAHEGQDLSRRDDLWSLFYIMLELYCGTLPWRFEDAKVQADRKALKEEIHKRKLRCLKDFWQYFISSDNEPIIHWGREIVDGHGPPGSVRGDGRGWERLRQDKRVHHKVDVRAMKEFEERVRALNFEQEPDYDRMLENFRAASNDHLRINPETGVPVIVNLRSLEERGGRVVNMGCFHTGQHKQHQQAVKAEGDHHRYHKHHAQGEPFRKGLGQQGQAGGRDMHSVPIKQERERDWERERERERVGAMASGRGRDQAYYPQSPPIPVGGRHRGDSQAGNQYGRPRSASLDAAKREPQQHYSSYPPHQQVNPMQSHHHHYQQQQQQRQHSSTNNHSFYSDANPNTIPLKVRDRDVSQAGRSVQVYASTASASGGGGASGSQPPQLKALPPQQQQQTLLKKRKRTARTPEQARALVEKKDDCERKLKADPAGFAERMAELKAHVSSHMSPPEFRLFVGEYIRSGIPREFKEDARSVLVSLMDVILDTMDKNP